MTEHANVYVALCAAQAEMGPLVKSAENEAFKRGGKVSRYAELADVVDAVREPFSKHGLAYFHAIKHDEHMGLCMVTTLVHGKSGTMIECPVPLIVVKNDMQGMKSATTYAKRVGLESVSGIAPEDDDGNAAAKAAPKGPSSAHMKRRLEALDADLADCQSEVAIDALARSWKAEINRDGWPDPAQDSDEYEHSYRRMVAMKFKARRDELEKWAAAQEAAE